MHASLPVVHPCHYASATSTFGRLWLAHNNQCVAVRANASSECLTPGGCGLRCCRATLGPLPGAYNSAVLRWCFLPHCPGSQVGGCHSSIQDGGWKLLDLGHESQLYSWARGIPHNFAWQMLCWHLPPPPNIILAAFLLPSSTFRCTSQSIKILWMALHCLKSFDARIDLLALVAPDECFHEAVVSGDAQVCVPEVWLSPFALTPTQTTMPWLYQGFCSALCLTLSVALL